MVAELETDANMGGMASEQDIPFVEPPVKWTGSKVIERKEGTRWYVERGPVQSFRHWLRELHEDPKLGNDLIPLQWVADFVGASRTAVRKRANTGGLTVFSFIVTEPVRTFLGTSKERDTRQRYDYAALSECKAWMALLMERADQENGVSK